MVRHCATLAIHLFTYSMVLMKNEPRPDPDSLLAAVQREEERSRRGKLKIFLGMVAGVGKTYAMLQAAQELLMRGANLVVGYVETHKRPETAELLLGLRIISRLKLHYRGVELEEMDLDAILSMRPEYVLVDELAHTNAEGARHKKRYQDILELLDHGINVFTTLNVQHIESLVDTVKQITGVAVYETVPDSVLDRADEIELVDLPPEALLDRLAEGKVYTPERSDTAMRNFFRKGNLTALREIALRKTAERVGIDLQDYMKIHRIEGPWKIIERLMVAIGTSPYSEQLIRWTRRLATTVDAPWIAVYVRTSRPLNQNEEKRLKQNMALAGELGAELVTTVDEDVVAALLRIAQQKNVTQIVVGRSPSLGIMNIFHRRSIVNRLIAESGGLDVYVVHRDKLTFPHEKQKIFCSRSGPRQYLLACGTIILASLLFFLATAFIDYRSVGMFLLFTVSILALFVGRGPIFAAATLSATIWNFFFIPPLFTFHIHSFSDWLMVGMYFIIALVGGELTGRIRGRETAVRRREEQAVSLYALARELNSARSLHEIVEKATQQIGSAFDARVCCFLPHGSESLSNEAHPSSTFKPGSEKEWSVASWVFHNRQPAGRGTNTLPFAEAIYYPLLTRNGIVGVVGIAALAHQPMPVDQEGLLQTFLHQIAVALEKEMLRAAAEQTHMLAESERLHKTLLNSISHELRTPLVTITGAASSLIESDTADHPERRGILVGDIYSAAQRLNRLVKNLLDMSRLESGMLKPNLQWCDAGDLVQVVLRNLEKELADHRIRTEIAPDLPLVHIDFVLMEQVLTNILMNSAQYTPAGTEITLRVAAVENVFAFVIEDEGPGFPQEEIEHIFEKFYRLQKTKPGGTGLGLSIAKGFVEAHRGTIIAENRMDRGARFIIRLPMVAAPPAFEEAES
jgi:two-component system sensor histidine kinase KdpD